MTEQSSGSGQQLYYAGIAAVVIVILLALWMLLKPAAGPDPEISTVPSAPEVADVVPDVPEQQTSLPEPAEPVPEVTFESEPEIAAAGPEPDASPLPTLEQSDPELKKRLLQLDWQPGLAGLLNTEQMVRNMVVTIDNLAQRQLVANHPVVAPLDQPFAATPAADGQTYQIDPAGYQRYEPYLQLLESVEPQQMLAIFERYQPLFAQAFAELGYPDMTFRQRLEQALKQFLAIEPVTADTTLLRPSVAYTYADPAVESRSALEKQVIRMGTDNHQRLRAVARRYLALLQQTD
tara:strand:+ start:1940 stop:2815 length:876 start_codon:yes stop_codon:yes gene_type:complete